MHEAGSGGLLPVGPLPAHWNGNNDPATAVVGTFWLHRSIRCGCSGNVTKPTNGHDFFLFLFLPKGQVPLVGGESVARRCG